MESMRAEATRDRGVDAARALAIIAIVLGHVERGLASASLLAADVAVPLDRLLYLFHVSTFAYLSGVFLERSMTRDGARRVVVRRAAVLVWLYLLWTVIQGSVRVAAGSVANTAVTFGDIARVWIPEGQLWFLPWLIAVTAVAAVTQPWRTTARAAVVLSAAAVMALAVWGYEPLYVFTRGWALLVPFLVGCVVTRDRHAVTFSRTHLVSAAAAFGTIVWLWVGLETGAVAPNSGGADRTVETVALGVLGCAAGTLGALAVAALLARTPFSRVLCVIGQRSLEIFLAHIVVASGTRIVLLQLGVRDPWLHLVLGTTLGVGVPLGIALVAERLGWVWLFGLPSRPRGLGSDGRDSARVFRGGWSRGPSGALGARPRHGGRGTDDTS